jgi:hypothetical protein
MGRDLLSNCGGKGKMGRRLFRRIRRSLVAGRLSHHGLSFNKGQSGRNLGGFIRNRGHFRGTVARIANHASVTIVLGGRRRRDGSEREIGDVSNWGLSRFCPMTDMA